MPTVGNVTAPVAVNEGQMLTLTAPSVTDNGATVSAQGWQISADGSTGWTDFTTSTTMTAAHNGQYLRYYATNSAGTGRSNTVQIAINGAPTLAVTAQNTISAPGTATVGQAFTITATGHRQGAAGSVNGDERYIPVSWSVNPSGTFPAAAPTRPA